MTQNTFKRDFIACFVGVVVMLSLSAAIILLLPIFILNEYFSAEYTEVIIIISIAFLVFAGTYMAGKMLTEVKGLKLIIVAISYFVPVLFLAIFAFDGLSLRNLYNVASGAMGGLAAVLILSKRKNTHIKRKKTKGYR